MDGVFKYIYMSSILYAMNSCGSHQMKIIEGVSSKNQDKKILVRIWRWSDESLGDFIDVLVKENFDFEEALYSSRYKVGSSIKEWVISTFEGFESVGIDMNIKPHEHDFSWFMRDREGEIKEEEKDDSFDEVSKPKHYNSGGIETQYLIDEFVSKIDNPKIGWRVANTLKYLDRFTIKENPLRDLKKAREYLDMCIRILEESNG